MTATHHAEQVRAGVAKLLGWLERHPAIPVAYVQYADAHNAEVELAAVRDGDDTDLGGLITTAEALSDVVITASDVRPHGSGRPVLTVQISGRTDPGDVLLIARAGLTGAHRTALRTALGGPSQPAKRSWLTSVAVLRQVADELATPAAP